MLRFAAAIAFLVALAMFVFFGFWFVQLTAGRLNGVFHETEALLTLGFGGLNLAVSALCSAKAAEASKG